MPLDISFVRENPEIVKKSQRDRFTKEEVIDEILKYDQEWKEAIKRLDNIRKESRLISKQIGEIMKNAVFTTFSPKIIQKILNHLLRKKRNENQANRNWLK